MPLNKVKGDMYDWCDYTFNTIKGKCPHDTEFGYCYMKKWGKQPALHFDAKELKTDLGHGNFIFVGSSCDMFADAIPDEWIVDTLEHCVKFDNRYLFQSKNPERIVRNRHRLPADVIIGTTIETNRMYKEMCNAPEPAKRAFWLSKMKGLGYKTMVTVEPIMSFNLDDLVGTIRFCRPSFVNIGANTNSKIELQEPKPEKIMALIEELKDFTEVKIKKNLKRLMK